MPDRTADAEQDAGLGRTHGQLARGRRIGAVLLGMEALGIMGGATFAAIDLRGREGLPPTYGAAMAGFLVVFALLLALAGLSLVRGGRFGVGYGITWQLFQALVGVTMLTSGLVLPGVLALGLAIASFAVLANLARFTPTPLEDEDPPGPRKR